MLDCGAQVLYRQRAHALSEGRAVQLGLVAKVMGAKRREGEVLVEYRIRTYRMRVQHYNYSGSRGGAQSGSSGGGAHCEAAKHATGTIPDAELVEGRTSKPSGHETQQPFLPGYLERRTSAQPGQWQTGEKWRMIGRNGKPNSGPGSNRRMGRGHRGGKPQFKTLRLMASRTLTDLPRSMYWLALE